MRVLRLRRGFTTNSSGTNEWIPSGSEQSRQAGQSPLLANTVMLGIIAVAIMLLFFIERFVRRRIRRWRSREDGEEDQ